MSERARAMLECHDGGVSLAEIAKAFGITRSRVSQLVKREEVRREQARLAGVSRETLSAEDLPVEHAGMSFRASQGLKNEGLRTLGDVADALDYIRLNRIPNLGKGSLAEIEQTLDQFGIRPAGTGLRREVASFLASRGLIRFSDIARQFGSGGPFGRDGRVPEHMPGMTAVLLADIRNAVDRSRRERTTSGSPFEDAIGFSRAIRVDSRILVSGTGPVEPDGTTTSGDAAAQAERVLAIILAAVEELGGCAADVVRTRIYLTDATDAAAVGAVHGRWLGEVRPAATMVVVAALLRPEWRVEIEAEAVLREGP